MVENKPNSTDRGYYMLALRIIGDFGATIAVPVVLFALVGQWLDDKYGKYPLFTGLCLLVSFVITAKIIVKKAKRYGEEYNKLK